MIIIVCTSPLHSSLSLSHILSNAGLMLEDMEALFSLDNNAGNGPDTGSNCFCFPDLKSQIMGFHVLPEERRISSSKVTEKCLQSDSKKTSELLFEPSSLHKYSSGMREMKLELFFGENEDEPLVSGIILPLLSSHGGREGSHHNSLLNMSNKGSSGGGMNDNFSHGNLSSSHVKNYNTIRSQSDLHTSKPITGNSRPADVSNNWVSRAVGAKNTNSSSSQNSNNNSNNNSHRVGSSYNGNVDYSGDHNDNASSHDNNYDNNNNNNNGSHNGIAYVSTANTNKASVEDRTSDHTAT